ncbi:MAG: CHAT domain-containing protein [Pseudomonadota bacterium]|nr:CHAT domain-containing protein [Pseudomonadota bacterium]
MPDWKRFRTAMIAGLPQADLVDACEVAWQWVDLSPELRRTRALEFVHAEASARSMLQAIGQVRLRLLREAGHSLDDLPRLQAYLDAVVTGRASPEQLMLASRTQATVEIGNVVAERFPSATLPMSNSQLATMVAAGEKLMAAVKATGVIAVTPQSVAALRMEIDAFAVIGKDFAPPVSQEHAWRLAWAWWAVSSAEHSLGHNEQRRDALERAAAFYATGNDPKSAEQCRQELRDLGFHLAADFDGAVAVELRALPAQPDPVAHAKALTRLAQEIGGTGDRFEAARTAETAAVVLQDAGYLDPEQDIGLAADSWIEVASRDLTQSALLAQICDVIKCWATILGARTSNRLKNDPPGSARAERVLREVSQVAIDFDQQAAQAKRELDDRLAVWNSSRTTQPPLSSDFEETRQRTAQMTALDDTLHALRLACNDGATDALLITAVELREQAAAMGSRVHMARAIVEQVYVLLALARLVGVPALTDEAIRTLLGDNPARLSSFATGYERELYLTAVDYKARALAGLADHEAILATCEPTIRDIESERARVSSPYQQSAFLATRAEIYEFAAAAAYKTKRYDLLLAVTELLKARAALRSRLVPKLDTDASDVEAQFREVNDSLVGAAQNSAEAEKLKERRRWLLTARAIVRAHAGGTEVPEISVAALQATLGADEAAVSWFLIANEVALVMAVTREGFLPVPVTLDAALQAQLREYLGCVTMLSGADPDFRKLIPKTAALIATLGESLLPAEIRAFIDGKSRLVLCPHRALHLFPFHAAPWKAGYLIQSFSIRYVPNLSSLLVPWAGNHEGPVLAVGVAHFDDPDIPSLPNAEAEATAVAAAHGDAGHTLAGATRAQLTALSLRDYRCLHLATHGSSVLAGDAVNDPFESCVYLRDGALSSWEIDALKLRAELVVIAACHSGQRSIAGRGLDRLPGDDLFGLQAVLFDSGAQTLLGALWPVHDATALSILTDFHRAYAGGATPDNALQTAILAHLDDTERRRDVFYWAPFFLSSLGKS